MIKYLLTTDIPQLYFVFSSNKQMLAYQHVNWDGKHLLMISMLTSRLNQEF